MDKGDIADRLDRQLATVPERDQLTEQEARRIGRSAQDLTLLRHARRILSEGGVKGRIVLDRPGKSSTLPLQRSSLEAAVALLIEREELFLASMNVQIERSE